MAHASSLFCYFQSDLRGLSRVKLWIDNWADHTQTHTYICKYSFVGHIVYTHLTYAHTLMHRRTSHASIQNQNCMHLYTYLNWSKIKSCVIRIYVSYLSRYNRWGSCIYGIWQLLPCFSMPVLKSYSFISSIFLYFLYTEKF